MSGFQSHRPLNPLSWLLAPAGLCILATIIVATPLRIFGVRLPEPVFVMILAFAWAVIRPGVLPPLLLLVLGLWLDLFWGNVLGLWSISLLTAYGLVLIAKPMMVGQAPSVMWMWYAGACFVAMMTGYLITMLVTLSMPGLVPVFWQFLATAALYPVAHRLTERFEDADIRFR